MCTQIWHSYFYINSVVKYLSTHVLKYVLNYLFSTYVLVFKYFFETVLVLGT